MHRGQPDDAPIGLPHIDQAQIRQHSNHEMGEPLVRARIVQGLREEIAHSRRHGQPLPGPPFSIQQARIVDGQAGPLAQLLGEPQIRFLVEAIGLRREHGHGAKGLAVRPEGDDHRRSQAESAHDLEGLPILDRLLQELI